MLAQNQGSTQAYVDFDRKDDLYGFGNLRGRISNLSAPQYSRCNTVRIYFADNSDTAAVIEGFNIRYTPSVRKDVVKKTKNYEDR